MAYKAEGKPIYKTANGREFNMDQFRQKNELSPAVGNIKVNARGDELGPGGKIIKKRNEILDEYYKDQVKYDETPVKKQTATTANKEEETVLKQERSSSFSEKPKSTTSSAKSKVSQSDVKTDTKTTTKTTQSGTTKTSKDFPPDTRSTSEATNDK